MVNTFDQRIVPLLRLIVLAVADPLVSKRLVLRVKVERENVPPCIKKNTPKQFILLPSVRVPPKALLTSILHPMVEPLVSVHDPDAATNFMKALPVITPIVDGNVTDPEHRSDAALTVSAGAFNTPVQSMLLQFRSTASITTVCPPEVKEFWSKNTSSADVGSDAPGAPFVIEAQ